MCVFLFAVLFAALFLKTQTLSVKPFLIFDANTNGDIAREQGLKIIVLSGTVYTWFSGEDVMHMKALHFA